MDRKKIAREIVRLARGIASSGKGEFSHVEGKINDALDFVEDASDWGALQTVRSKQAMESAEKALIEALNALGEAWNSRDKTMPV